MYVDVEASTIQLNSFDGMAIGLEGTLPKSDADIIFKLAHRAIIGCDAELDEILGGDIATRRDPKVQETMGMLISRRTYIQQVAGEIGELVDPKDRERILTEIKAEA